MMQSLRRLGAFSGIEGSVCYCRRNAFEIKRKLSRWSLGINRKAEKPKLEVISKAGPTKANMRHKDAKILAREERFDNETKKYELGKRWLAAMMGEDIETFDEGKIRESLDYLLPSHLFAKDARPMLKDPIRAYGHKEEIVLDDNDRPLDAGFYTKQPRFHQSLYDIYKKRELLSEAMKIPSNLSFSSSEDASRRDLRWMVKGEMENHLQEGLKDEQYDLLINRLEKLKSHPCNHLISEFLSTFEVELNRKSKERVILEIDEDGVVTSMGYRKDAIADVKVKRGNGEFLINGMNMHDYFTALPERHQIMFPYLVIDGFGKFDVDASVIGGGVSGQAGAIRLGLSRALPSFNEAYYELLEEAGLLLIDYRSHERNKPGQKGARKKFAWVKR